jgi:penicillin amidase
VEDQTELDAPRRPKVRGRKRRAALGLVLLGTALVLGARWLEDRRQQRAAHPTVAGQIELASLDQAVEIVRDRNGVPHVRAQSEHDAWFGLGFAHAQDRLGQMLWLRHQARGRTAAQIGPSGLPADRWARTLGLAQLAERDFQRSTPDAKRVLTAYSAGVNAWLARLLAGEADAPLGLTQRLDEVEPWVPADSLALAKLRAWQLASVADEMLALEAVVRRLGPHTSRPFFPDFEAESAPSHRAEVAPRPNPIPVEWNAPMAPLRVAGGLAGARAGSSAWVISGRFTKRGRPLLAGDLHAAPRVPAAFYEAHLRGGSLEVAGATVPGVPVFWMGFSPHIGWAATHAPAQVMDLVEETLFRDDPSRYLEQGRWRSLQTREETIEVRGGTNETLSVLSTRSGPRVDGLLGADRPLSLRWTGQQVGGIGAFVALTKASDAEALARSLRRHGEPLLAVAWAGNDGDGGVQVAGAAPVREISAGFQPVPAGNPSFGWAGWVPQERLPSRTLGPGRPWAIAADGGLLDDDGVAVLEPVLRAGPRGHRVEHLLQLAADDGAIDLGIVVAMQRDRHSASADRLVASALRLAGDLGHEEAQVAELLAAWDRDTAASSRGAAAHHVFVSRLAQALMVPVLDEALTLRLLSLPRFRPELWVEDTLLAAEQGGLAVYPWTAPETVKAAVRSSLRQTWLTLSVDLGSNRDKWSWGRLHPVRFSPLWPGAWDDPVGLGPFPYGGDGSTLAAAEFSMVEGPSGRARWETDLVSTYRFALDVGNLDQALSSLVPGQSGHPAHGHSRDGVEGWLRGQPSLLSTSDPVVEDGPVARLRLVPSAVGEGPR